MARMVMVPKAELQAITVEHRQCGTPDGYDGCYSHWPHPHCRADGMAWPCDVQRIADTVAGLDERQAARERLGFV